MCSVRAHHPPERLSHPPPSHEFARPPTRPLLTRTPMPADFPPLPTHASHAHARSCVAAPVHPQTTITGIKLRTVRKSGRHSTAPAFGFSPSASAFNAGTFAFGSTLPHTAGGSAPFLPMLATGLGAGMLGLALRAVRGHGGQRGLKRPFRIVQARMAFWGHTAPQLQPV